MIIDFSYNVYAKSLCLKLVKKEIKHEAIGIVLILEENA